MKEESKRTAKMLIAIAGSGDFAQYISEEFPRAGHEVVFLTRSRKPRLEKKNIRQFITDFSINSLDTALKDCEVLISTIVDLSSTYVEVHMRLLSACERSARCKRFIPSEFAGNVRDYPDQPAYSRGKNDQIRNALREQNEVEWTVVCIGLFADYIVPGSNRYIRDMREGKLIDFDQKKILVPESLDCSIDRTSARDVAKALATLVKRPNWGPFTYLSGEHTTWRGIVATIRKRYPEFVAQVQSLNQIMKSWTSSTSDEDALYYSMQLYTASGAAVCPEHEVKLQKEKFFKNVEFRSMECIWGKVDSNWDAIV